MNDLIKLLNELEKFATNTNANRSIIRFAYKGGTVEIIYKK